MGGTHVAAPAVQTVELSGCERTQALALQVLLSLAKFNQHRIQEMDCYHGYSMIHQVLIKSKCIVGFHVLKVSRTSNPPPSEICPRPGFLISHGRPPPDEALIHGGRLCWGTSGVTHTCDP